MQRLKIDFNYAMKRFVSCGLADEDLEQYKNKARVGLSSLLDLRAEGSVGFMDLPSADFSDMKPLLKKIKGKYNDLIVVGIGGSSLGLEALVDALLPFGYNAVGYAERGCNPRVWVADNVDPSKMSNILKECGQEDTFALVISKSGSTVESAANFTLVYNWLSESVKDVSNHMAVITDPEKGPLRALANEKNLASFTVPDNVGGRFSILSHVGLLPGAMLGMETDKILAGAKDMAEEGHEMVLTLSAVYMYFIDNGFNINVLMPYSGRLRCFADWFCQLWGESLGKNSKLDGSAFTFGTTPVKALGAIDQHSQLQLYKEGPMDKIITFIEVGAHENELELKSGFKDYKYLNGVRLGQLCNIELKTSEAALKNVGRPSVKISVDTLDEHTLGKLIMLYEMIVPVIGLSYGINPFDQPGVEEGKQYAYGLLGKEGFDVMKKRFEEIYEKHDDYII